MPGKYDNAFPNAPKVQIFEQVDTYIENNHSTEATQQLTQLLAKQRRKYLNKTDAEIFEILINGFATIIELSGFKIMQILVTPDFQGQLRKLYQIHMKMHIIVGCVEPSAFQKSDSVTHYC